MTLMVTNKIRTEDNEKKMKTEINFCYLLNAIYSMLYHGTDSKH